MEIDDDTSAVIKHCRKSFLFSRDSAWINKSGSLFDETMGFFDGAEVCEMVRLFLLHQLAKLVGKSNIGLYRDDGLAILDASGPDLDRLRKKIIKLSQSHGLKIISKHQTRPNRFSRRYTRSKIEKILAISQTYRPTALHTPPVKPPTRYQKTITIYVKQPPLAVLVKSGRI